MTILIRKSSRIPRRAVDVTPPMTTSGGKNDGSFEQEFSDALSVTVTHDLGKRPSVTVYDTTGDEMFGIDVDVVDLNTITVSFAIASSGIVVCE